MERTKAVTLTVGALALGAVAYAVYFDYKRRNDATFRRTLRKEKKRVNKAVAELKASLPPSEGGPLSQDVLREALEQIKQEQDVPTHPSEKEQYFMLNVGNGEALAAKGPDSHLQAALYFYRALRVYPSPVELIMIYQKTVPEPIFKIIMDLTNLDTESKVQEYYKIFPPKSFNAVVEEKKAVSTQEKRRVLVTTKAIRKGDTIYKENPVITALDEDLRERGTHCEHCLRKIPPGWKKVPGTYTLTSVFCSDTCSAAADHANSILFTLKPPLAGQPSATSPEERKQAQVDYVEYLKTVDKKEGEGKSNRALLIARFIARQLDEEIAKVFLELMGKTAEIKRDGDDYTDAEKAGEYTLADHLERLRLIDVTTPKEERELLSTVINKCSPGFEQFINEERYNVFLGKMAYNAFGVYHGEGRTDKPEPTGRPEEIERTRTPLGTSTQVGSAFYTVSSYLSHSCGPNAKVSYPKNDSQIHVVALEDIEEGAEITIAYVDVSQTKDEDAAGSRQRRRAELARGWKLGCACPRCVEEGKLSGKTTTAKDDSKLETGAAKVSPLGGPDLA